MAEVVGECEEVWNVLIDIGLWSPCKGVPRVRYYESSLSRVFFVSRYVFRILCFTVLTNICLVRSQVAHKIPVLKVPLSYNGIV